MRSVADAAILMTNQVFAKTWGGRAGREPGEEFWPAVIAGLRSRYPQTVLVSRIPPLRVRVSL